MTPRAILGALSVLTILGGSALVANRARTEERHDALRTDRERMAQLVGGISAETSRLLTVTDSTASLMAVGGLRSDAEFRALSRRIGDEPGLGYLSWMPRVAERGRAAWERANGPIWVYDLSSNRLPAPPGPGDHFPVRYTADGVEQHGFDPGTFAFTTSTAQRAAATGRTAVSPPMGLSTVDLVTQQAVLFVPVRRSAGGRSAVVGLIGSSIVVSRLRSVRAVDATSVQVRDDDAVFAGPRELRGPVLSRRLTVGDRTWTVSMARSAGATNTPWFVLAAGASIAALVAFLFAGGHRRERRALELVRRRLAEREAAEARLRAERDQSQSLVDALQDGLIVLGADGSVVRVNERVAELTGFSHAELEGWTGPLPFVSADEDGAASAFALLRERERLEVEVRLAHRDGRDVWVILTAAALHGVSGTAGHLVSLKDITERRRAERELQERAATDALTGLPNHRTFHDALTREVAAAAERGTPLAVAVLDLDHFKQVNDTLGHQAGDEALREVARRLRSCVRGGDVLARVGGEEFAWLLPGIDADAAFAAVERAREAVSGIPVRGVGRVSLSAGVSDTATAASAAELYRFADGALYWAKANGRDRTFVYAPEVVEATSADEHASRLERLRTVTTIQALARAVDARDASTRRHSERVADLAAAIAGELGWNEEDRRLLHEAGLVHDVGKIGVSDAVLFKPGRLTAEEYEQVKTHAALGAQIVSGALGDTQASWVRGHHERWDGAGYPDGLAGEAIPEGARILAVADAWDVMTVARHYSAPRDVEGALAECRAVSGSQFWPPAVAALARMAERGDRVVPVAVEAPETAGETSPGSTFPTSADWSIVGSPRKGGDPV